MRDVEIIRYLKELIKRFAQGITLSIESEGEPGQSPPPKGIYVMGRDTGSGKSEPIPISGGTLPVTVAGDSAGLAKDATLGTVASRLYDPDESKSVTAILKEIRDKPQWSRLSNLDVPLSSISAAPGSQAPSRGVLLLGLDTVNNVVRPIAVDSEGRARAVLG